MMTLWWLLWALSAGPQDIPQPGAAQGMGKHFDVWRKDGGGWLCAADCYGPAKKSDGGWMPGRVWADGDNPNSCIERLRCGK